MCGARTRAPEQDVVGNVTYGKHLSTDEILAMVLAGVRTPPAEPEERPARHVTLADTAPPETVGEACGSPDWFCR